MLKFSFLTMSFSVSVFVKQWPFMTGLDGSLSDNTITSSGEGGCRSFLMSLREEMMKDLQSTQNPQSISLQCTSTLQQNLHQHWIPPKAVSFRLDYSPCTPTAASGHQCVKLLKFAGDTTLTSLIYDKDESAFRSEMDCLV